MFANGKRYNNETIYHLGQKDYDANVETHPRDIEVYDALWTLIKVNDNAEDRIALQTLVAKIKGRTYRARKKAAMEIARQYARDPEELEANTQRLPEPYQAILRRAAALDQRPLVLNNLISQINFH